MSPTVRTTTRGRKCYHDSAKKLPWQDHAFQAAISQQNIRPVLAGGYWASRAWDLSQHEAGVSINWGSAAQRHLDRCHYQNHPASSR